MNILKGNLEPRKSLTATRETTTVEQQPEQEGLKRFGGSIALNLVAQVKSAALNDRAPDGSVIRNSRSNRPGSVYHPFVAYSTSRRAR